MYQTLDTPGLVQQRIRTAKAMHDLDHAIHRAFAEYSVLERRLAAFDVRAAEVRSRLHAAGYLTRREDHDHRAASPTQSTRRRARKGRPFRSTRIATGYTQIATGLKT